LAKNIYQKHFVWSKKKAAEAACKYFLPQLKLQ